MGSPDTPHPVVTLDNVSHYCGCLCQREETDIGTLLLTKLQTLFEFCQQLPFETVGGELDSG